MPSLKLRMLGCSAFQALPDEILLHIFSVGLILTPLDHAHLAATCARFRRLAEDPVLWRDVSLGPYRSFTDDSTIQILVRTRFAAAEPGVVRLQSLDISKCSNITDMAVGLIARGCPGLVKLDLSECVKISDWSMAELGQRCPRLQDLNIKLCADVTDAGIGALVGAGKAPAVLDGFGQVSPLSPVAPPPAGGPGGAAQAASTSSLVSLRRLDVSWCDKLTDRALEHVGVHCPRLSVLKMSFSGKEITDRGIQYLLGTAPSGGEDGEGPPHPPHRKSGDAEHPLRVLEAAMSPSLTSLALRTLLDRAPHLDTLVITWCEKIKSPAVSEFRRKRPVCSVQYNTAPMAL